MTHFAEFFKEATGNIPYDYQKRLAELPLESRLIDIPTGLGKTAAVIVAWLWNRVHLNKPDWPRRLVYCLPMRTLVEQTRDETQKWVNALSEQKLIANKPRVVILMGGESPEGDEKDWDLYPEDNTILIGTQDMLLSRALNRGYGMSRARWPMHFGLLNNDSLWVMDETQLMGVGVPTSAQLEGLRQRIGLAANSYTWWASATLDTRLLSTPDFSSIPNTIALDTIDTQNQSVADRVHAVKRLSQLPCKLIADSAKEKTPYLDQLASQVLEKHQPGTLTLVILNRVDRACDLYINLQKLAKKASVPPLLLVHSRFRPMERVQLNKALRSGEERILIATQAVEAGVDISARTLITELAPWPSMIQRFGRCNRKGEFNTQGGADIFWINLEAEDEKASTGLSLPYTPEQLANARSILLKLENQNASPSELRSYPNSDPLPAIHILRRKDLIELFDTTPDLTGWDIDVGRYIREDEDRDVQVFWRTLNTDKNQEPDETISPQSQELVRVSVSNFKKFADKNKGEIWAWDTVDGAWRKFTETYSITPGRIFLVNTSCGGYSTSLGWTGTSSKESFPVLDSQPLPSTSPRDGQNLDDESQTQFQSIAEHTAHVVAACEQKITALADQIDEEWGRALRTAALWHDVGKAHPCFQNFLTRNREIPLQYANQFLAKAPWQAGVRFERPHFRHELASALAWLQAGNEPDSTTHNLVAWLIMTHHGKIRLSLRAMPGEKVPVDENGSPIPSALFARGVWDHDTLSVNTEQSLQIDEIPISIPPLNMSLVQMGEQSDAPSWTYRALSLRDAPHIGVFRLAWLESILRASDAIGSQQ
jgi:CRISPR-associated endonuclease/helicase Cas3